jgi:hypothetical protein
MIKKNKVVTQPSPLFKSDNEDKRVAEESDSSDTKK